MNYLGDFAEDAIVRIFFSTHDKDGGVVAPSSEFEEADVKIYKNGSSSEKTTTNGLTMTSPFDAVVGLHLLVIDTSNDTGDAGFWEAGAEYTVVLTPDETIDGETVISVIGSFSLERASAAIARLKTMGVQVTSIVNDLANVETKVDVIDGIVDTILVDVGSLPSAADFADEVVEGAITLRQAITVMLAYLAGKASGGGTASITFRNQADSLNRITMTVNEQGDRTNVALNLA